MKIALALLVGSLAIVAQDAATNVAQLSGTVTSTDGKPVQGATVSVALDPLAMLVQNGPPQSLVDLTPVTATTAEDGTFTLRGVQSGTHRLRVEASGYLRQELGAKPGATRTGTVLSIKPNDRIAHLNVQLTRESTISGRVLLSNGDPAVGIPVHAVRAVYTGGVRRYQEEGSGSTSDSRGDFRIDRLSPGRYFVYANPPLERGRLFEVKRTLLPTYHPNALRVPEAIAVNLVEGGDGFADVRLRDDRPATVRGRVMAQGDHGDRAPSGAAVLVMPDADMPLLQDPLSPQRWPGLSPQDLLRKRAEQTMRAAPPYAGIATTDGDGSFALSGVVPGLHRLIAFGGKRMTLSFAGAGISTRTIGFNTREPETPDDGTSGSIEINVGREDVDGVVIHLGPASGEITTTATIDGKPYEEWARTRLGGLLPKMSPQAQSGALRATVRFVPEDNVSYGGQATGRPGEPIANTNKLSPGRYRVDVNGSNLQYFIASMKLNGVDIARQPLDFTGGSALLEIALSLDSAAIGGTVADGGGNAMLSALVSLWPVNPDRSRQDGGSMMAASSLASFSFSRVPPGEYYLAAFEDLPDPGLAQYMPFLAEFAAKAKRIKVDANASEFVRLEAISAEDAQRVFATLR